MRVSVASSWGLIYKVCVRSDLIVECAYGQCRSHIIVYIEFI